MNTETPKSKSVKALWAVLIILVVGVIMAGVVMRFAFMGEIQDQINSLVFKTHRTATTTQESKATTTTEQNIIKK